MGGITTQNMQSSLQKYKTVYGCILLDNYWHGFVMHGPTNIKYIRTHVNTKLHFNLS
jgi:hypothetical protein